MRVLLVVYDNGSYVHYFPQGTAYIAAALRDAGHEVSLWLQDVHHYPDEQLTGYMDEHGPFDVVGIGVIGGYWQFQKLLNLSQAIAKAKHRPFYVLGGHGPSADAAYFLRKTGADAVVIGEGEGTVVDLLDALEKKRSLSEVAGLVWREDSAVRTNPERPLIQDLDTIAWPAYDMFPMEYYRLVRINKSGPTDFVMPVLSGRGCTFKCTFCYRIDKGYRRRSAQGIIDEIRFLKERYGVNYICFSDELLMVSEQQTVELCDAFIESGVDFKWWCNGRLNYAKPYVLEKMKQAGCSVVSYGIEAMDNDVLRQMKKGLRVEQVYEGINNTIAAGLTPNYNIIFGNIGDTKETLEKGVEFLLHYTDGSQMRTIRPVTPYPGSPLFFTAIERGLLKDTEDFYEHKHVNSDLLAVNFTDMTDDEFHTALFYANERLINRYFELQAKNAVDQARDLYFKGDASFRGFRQK